MASSTQIGYGLFALTVTWLTIVTISLLVLVTHLIKACFAHNFPIVDNCFRDRFMFYQPLYSEHVGFIYPTIIYVLIVPVMLLFAIVLIVFGICECSSSYDIDFIYPSKF